jgi:hypothetical protein
MKRYYIVGDKLLCFIPRTGSTSLLTIIQDKHYPNQKTDIDIHFSTPSIIDDGKSELVSMFRNPIERFVSGCAQLKWSIERGIEELKKPIIDVHIRPQYTFLSEQRPTKLFKFPDQLTECAVYLGLESPLPHLKKSISKPELTEEQTAYLIEFYAKDLELFNAL